ncbi:MAG: thioredoxin domain-containing protein [Patescibacteria group bacterium]
MSELYNKPSLFAGASPKFTFIMGLVSGVAAVSLIGFVLIATSATPGLLAKLGNNLAVNPSPQAGVPNAPGGEVPPPPLGKQDIKVKSSDYIRGSKNAPVTVITYSDLECPFCKRFHPGVLKLMNDYKGKVRLIYRHFPLSFHANAQKEAEASECVGKLGGADKYWSFIDKIFERSTVGGTGFALDKLGPLAKEVGVDQTKFQKCLDDGEFAAKVQTDLQEGAGFGVGGTPTTFVNGTPVEGAVPFEQLKAVVDQELAK